MELVRFFKIAHVKSYYSSIIYYYVYLYLYIYICHHKGLDYNSWYRLCTGIVTIAKPANFQSSTAGGIVSKKSISILINGEGKGEKNIMHKYRTYLFTMF